MQNLMASGVPAGEQLLLDRQLCFPLYAASRAVTARYAPLLAELKLTYPQYLVMLTLWEQNPLSVTEVGRRLRLDSGTLSPLLKRLEAAGLVSRRRDPSDERRVLVGLTNPGMALKRRAAHIPGEIAAAIGLSEESYVALKSQLSDLLARLGEPGQL